MTPPAPPQGAKKMSPDNLPAFPALFQSNRDDNGMTLRDWFAGQAMAAYINTPRPATVNGKPCDEEIPIAEAAYKQGDAMLVARSGPPPERPTA